LDRIYKELPTRRSALPDGVGGKAWKKSRPVTYDYVKRLFRACVKTSYHPLQFRYAISIMLKKPGKATYTEPSSWRPIDLLSPLGKMLEKFFNIRMVTLAKSHAYEFFPIPPTYLDKDLS